jgi:hypothetical protein
MPRVTFIDKTQNVPYDNGKNNASDVNDLKKGINTIYIKGQYYASDYGLVADGVTDNTAAFQAMINDVATKTIASEIYFDYGVYLISGQTLQDVWTGGANAIIQLPQNPLSNPMIVITFKGAVHPLISHFVWNGDPLRHGTVFKATFTNPTDNRDAAIFAGTSYNASNQEPNQNHVQLNIIDIICECPYDPKFTFFNLRYQMANRMENVIIYGGSTSLASSCYANAPVNDYAYGVKLPEENHTPNNPMDNVRVMGFYNGYMMSECMATRGVRASGCRRGFHMIFGWHISVHFDLHVYWCPIGIFCEQSRMNHIHKLRIFGYSVEHKGTVAGGGDWMNNVADVYDAENFLKGDMVYSSLQAGIGVSNFVKVGGTYFKCTAIEDVAV